MFSNYLKIALRNFRKNKFFVISNVIGLGLALACCIIAYLNWDFNSSFDDQHVHAEDIYRVNFVRITNGRPIKNGSSPFPIREVVKNSVPQVERSTRYYPAGGNLKFNDVLFRTWIAGVDPEFFQMFSFDLISGNLTSISDRRTIVVSDELVVKHFPGLQDPIGQTITYINGDKRIDFQIGAIYKKPPLNSSFFADAFFHFENITDIDGYDLNDWALFNNTFVMLPHPEDIESVEQELNKYVAVQNEAKKDYKVDHFYLDHFPGMAVRAEREDIWNHWLNQSLPVAAATAPGIMAFLLLLLACFNFTNTSIAIANRRLREIGIRKVMGSDRRQIVWQFLGENAVLALLALSAGILFGMILVPAYSAMWVFLEIKLDLFGNYRLLLFLFVLWLFTTIVSGAYPAFYVSRFQPQTILKGDAKVLGTNALTRVLLTLQYALCLISIICSIVFMKNAEYQNEYDLGFDINQMLYAYVIDSEGYRTFRNELESVPGITSMAGSRHAITTSWYSDPIRIEERELDVDIMDIGHDYLTTVGGTVLEGRNFQQDSRQDRDESVIVNEELVRQLSWADPIGQRVLLADTVELTVVGVVKDIYYDGALWDPLEPLLLRYTTEDRFRYLTVATSPANLANVKTAMDQSFRKVFPDQLSTVRAMDEDRAESVEVNVNIKTLFLCLAIVALILSVIGLFSLVSLNVNRRMKEIGIRKILGASVGNIAFRISREFIIIFAIASILGGVAGYYLSILLMGSIWAYYIQIGPVILIGSILILLVVSFGTVGGKIFEAANITPAKTLKRD
ncbi:MAG: ABC transporter permease [Saprospiraceae bacterium]|nr:ABC transporter permease [Saprospiraceae bacterium]